MEEGFVLRWRLAWKEQKFKQLTLTGIVFFIITLIALPFFFNYIQQREGSQINDFLLNQITPRNVSNWVFSIIWSMAILTLIRCIQQPNIFLIFLWGFILLSLSFMPKKEGSHKMLLFPSARGPTSELPLNTPIMFPLFKSDATSEISIRFK